MTPEQMYAMLGSAALQQQQAPVAPAALLPSAAAIPALAAAVQRPPAPRAAPKPKPAAKAKSGPTPRRGMGALPEAYATLGAVSAPMAGLASLAAMLPAVDNAVLGEEPSAAPQAAKKAAPKAAQPKSRRNPEQDIFDALLAQGGKWSLNQLGAIAGAREAPGGAPPMKDVVMGEGMQLIDLDWQRRAAAADALEDGEARNAALDAAIDRRRQSILQMLGQGIGPIDIE